jgi:hypothetical protein
MRPVPWADLSVSIKATSVPVPDPTPFLATIAGVSATFVAIIGGLLVARYVTLDSEQQGAQHLLDDANARLKTARKRAKQARQNLYSWDVNSFFRFPVIAAIGRGEQDLDNLRDIGYSTRLSDEHLRHNVEEIRAEFDKARGVLPGLVMPAPDGDDQRWEDFQRAQRDVLPETLWDDVWKIVHDELLAPPPKPRSVPPIDTGNLRNLVLGRPPEYVALDVERRDGLESDFVRADQRREDVAAEVAHLQRSHDAITRPRGLAGGLVVLSLFTIAGVIVPLLIMSRAPKALTPGLGELVFWLFFGGLVLLLGYMSVLAMRLSTRGQTVLAAIGRRLHKWAGKVKRRPKADSPKAELSPESASPTTGKPGI